MDSNFDITSYRERWMAIDEIERYLLGDLDRGKYNLMERLLICLGVLHDEDVEHMQIILRWARLKDIYEQQQPQRTT